MTLKSLFIAAGAIVIASAAAVQAADTDPRAYTDEARRKARENMQTARSRARAITDSARAKANRIYSEGLLKKWKTANEKKPVLPPSQPLPLPDAPTDTLAPTEDNIITATELPPQADPVTETDPLFDFSDLDLSPYFAIDIPDLNLPVPPTEVSPTEGDTEMQFYGVRLTMPRLDTSSLNISGTSEQDVSNAWQRFTDAIPATVIASLQRVGEELQLCDWAYLQLADAYLTQFLKRESNEWSVALANVMNRSGIDVRLARAQNDIIAIIGTEYVIYYRTYYPEGGLNFITYPEKRTITAICDARYPKVRPLALNIPREMIFAERLSEPRTLKSKRYPEVKGDVCVNLNLIDFYNDFPAAQHGNDISTHWAMRAATPVSQGIRNSLYPELRKAIDGLDERAAAERLLNLVQTALVYDFDSNVWGGERSFFPEETAYYPFADCEDRSALFTALVRDLLELDTALVIYPDHVATAVAFNQDQTGDAVMLNGRKFVICDPTYIGASTGRMMPQMHGVKADVIRVK